MATVQNTRRLGCRLCALLDEGNDSGFSCEEQKRVLREDSAVRMQATSLPEQVLQSGQSVPAAQSWKVKLQDAPHMGELTKATETRTHVHMEPEEAKS